MKSFTTRILGILLIIGISTSLFSVVYHMNNEAYKTETAVYSQEDDSVTFKAVYVRDEEVLRYSGAGVVSYTVPDGGKLANGSAIAEIYADESQIDVKQKLSELENEMSILQKIQNPGTIQSAQPANLSALIKERYHNIINAREKGNISDIRDDSDELVVLLSTYQLVTDEAVDFTKSLNDIKSEISSLRSGETVPLDTIVSDRSGYFVSYADGYEDTLTMDKLSSITPDMIDKVSDSGRSEDKDVIGKLITGCEWYVVGVIDNKKEQFEVEEEVKLKFQSTSELIDGTVFDIRDTNSPDKELVIVKCDEITYDLVQHRTERVEMIKGNYEGIKVSRNAIRFRDVEETVVDEATGKEVKQKVSCKGVYVKLGEQITFKKLDVVYEGDNFVLSALNAGSGYVSMYDDVVVEGVDADGNGV